MKVPLLDLEAQYRPIMGEVEKAIASVLGSHQHILGPAVQDCERAIAQYSNCTHGIGVSSGTDALLVCLMAEGIGAGDEVITTPYTFFATAGCVARLGAKPVFADIDPITYNINPSQIATQITGKTKAIMPVHLYGQMADMDPIMHVAEKHGLAVIEDAAQAIGSEYKGKRAGSIGHYGCFSFYPSKNLGAAGDGGMVVTNDPVRAERVACLRAHGSNPKYYHKVIGGNFRLDSLQAAIVLTKLRHLDGWTAGRQRNAERYHRLFRDSGICVANTSSFPKARWHHGVEVYLPTPAEDRHIYNQYVIRVRGRDALKSFLREKGVGTEIYYPVPLHRQECFGYLGIKPGAFPESESAAAETLALPVYPELTDEQTRYVVDCIADFFRSKKSACS